MDEKDLIFLDQLKKYNNITQTASAMYISQPAVTRRLHNLETEFHTAIAVRQNNGIKLTKAGEYLADFSTEMLARIAEAKNHVLELDNQNRELRIGIPRMFSQLRMPLILSGFSKLHPDILTYTLSGFSTEIKQWLFAGKIQLAFLRGKINDQNYSVYPVERDPICIISKSDIDLKDLPNLPRIRYQTDPQLKAQMDGWIESTFPGQTMKMGIDVGDSQTCVMTVEQGLGYALLPLYVVPDNYRITMNIIPIRDKDGEIIIRDTSLVYPKRNMNAAEASFVAYIMDTIPKVELTFPGNSQQDL